MLVRFITYTAIVPGKIFTVGILISARRLLVMSFLFAHWLKTAAGGCLQVFQKLWCMLAFITLITKYSVQIYVSHSCCNSPNMDHLVFFFIQCIKKYRIKSKKYVIVDRMVFWGSVQYRYPVLPVLGSQYNDETVVRHGDMDLGQRWAMYWPVVCGHQSNTLAHVNLFLMKIFCGIQLGAISPVKKFVASSK